MEEIIRAVDITFTYQENETQPVIDNVSLTVREGEFVSVLGHNGSGKSTLAKHLNGILLPSGGKVFIYDMDTADEESIYDIRKTVGLVFQNPDNQLVTTIVEEDVAFALENLGVPPDEIRKRVDEALLLVDMYDYREYEPHKLSGGQKQRIAIAGIIAMSPRCIVLDEPTAMLDPHGRAEVLTTIKRLNEEKGITVVIITHYMDEAARTGRVVVMDKGRVLLDGTPREIFSQVELLKSVGLDVPQTTELLFELKKEGHPLPDGVLSVDDCVEAILKLRDEK